jgi:hypothetical protein
MSMGTHGVLSEEMSLSLRAMLMVHASNSAREAARVGDAGKASSAARRAARDGAAILASGGAAAALDDAACVFLGAAGAGRTSACENVERWKTAGLGEFERFYADLDYSERAAAERADTRAEDARSLARDFAAAVHELNLQSDGLCAFCTTTQTWDGGPVYAHEAGCEAAALLHRARVLGLRARS